jgi:hypothetical protein
MAQPVAVGHLVLIDVSGTGDLVEYDGEGGYVQQIAPPPAGVGGGIGFIAQLGGDLLLVPEAASDIRRTTRSGNDLGVFVSAHEFGAGTIFLAQVDESARLIVLYAPADDPDTPRLKRFHADGTLETDFGPIPLADGFVISGNQVGAAITPDGATVYLAAGQYVDGGNRHLPIVKVTLDEDLGVPVVTDRWATAVSGTDSSPGGGASSSGAALAVDPTSGEVLAVVAVRQWPPNQEADATFFMEESLGLGAGESAIIVFGDGSASGSWGAVTFPTSEFVLPFAEVCVGNVYGMYWHEGDTQVRVAFEGSASGGVTSTSVGAGHQAINGVHLPATLTDGVLRLKVTNLGPSAIVWNRYLGQVFNGNANIDGSAADPADSSTVQYLLHRYDAEGNLIGVIALDRLPWEDQTHQPFGGPGGTLAQEPASGTVVVPLGEPEGTGVVEVEPDAGTVTQVTADLFGDAIAHPNLHMMVYTLGPTPIPYLTTMMGAPQSAPGSIQTGRPVTTQGITAFSYDPNTDPPTSIDVNYVNHLRRLSLTPLAVRCLLLPPKDGWLLTEDGKLDPSDPHLNRYITALNMYLDRNMDVFVVFIGNHGNVTSSVNNDLTDLNNAFIDAFSSRISEIADELWKSHQNPRLRNFSTFQFAS